MNTRILALVWVVACIVVISGCGRKYTATAVLRIKAEEPAVLAGSARIHAEKEYESYGEKQRELLTSRIILMVALRKPEVGKLPSVHAETQNGDSIRWLAGIIKVKFPGRAEVMSVSCTTNDPHEAATLTNAVVDAYMAEIVDAEQERLRQSFNGLERCASEVNARVGKMRAELDRLTSIPGAGNAKGASSKSEPANVVSLRSDIKNVERVSHEYSMECERIKKKLRALPRVSVILRRRRARASRLVVLVERLS